MNVSDIVLFKKSKIIEIGSVEKKLELREVGGFWKNLKILGFSYLKSGILVPKLCLPIPPNQKIISKFWKSRKTSVNCSPLSFYAIGIIFGIRKLNKISNTENLLDFRFFWFFLWFWEHFWWKPLKTPLPVLIIAF